MDQDEARTSDATAERRAIGRALQAIAMRQRDTDAYGIIATELRTLLRASTVAVGLIAPQTSRVQSSTDPGGPMDFVAVAGADPREIVGLRVAADDTLCVNALRVGRPTVFLPDPHSAVRSGAICPIVSVSGVRGAIYAVDREGGAPFEDHDLDIMSVFAQAAGMVVESAQASRELAEKQRELAVLYETTRTVTSSLNIQGVLDSVLDAICHHIPVQAAVVYLLNDERTHLFIAADRGLSDDEREVQLAADTGVAARVLNDGEPLLLTDTDSIVTQASRQALGDIGEVDIRSADHRQRSAMVTPIRSASDVMGLLTVSSAAPGAYGDDELRLLTTVAAQAGIAMDNAALFEDATRRAEAASALFSISQRIGSTLDIAEALDYVADHSVALLQVDKFAVMLMDHRDGLLHPHAMRGLDQTSFAAITPRSGEGIAGWVHAWTAPTAVADVAADARDKLYPIHQEGVASCMCVPMASGDTVLGVLLAMSSRRRLFTVAELELLYTIANQAAAAVVNAQTYARAHARAQAMRRYFRRLAAALGASIDRAHILQLVTDVALDVMEADRCNIYTLRDQTLHLEAQSRLAGTGAPDPEIGVGVGLTGWVAARGRSLAVPKLAEDRRTREHAWGGRESLASYLGLPLKAGRKTTGVLEIMTREPRAFAPDEVRLLSQFISRARIGERLQEDTNT